MKRFVSDMTNHVHAPHIREDFLSGKEVVLMELHHFMLMALFFAKEDKL
jgi:hypothetical protein